MLNELQEIEETLKYEPLLVDLLHPKITYQEARILAILFKSGGYLTLNTLVEKLDVAQPTVSNVVKNLVNKGFIRKNIELIPKALVLLLEVKNLESIHIANQSSEYFALTFLSKVTEINNLVELKDLIVRAFEVIYSSNFQLAKLLANIYISPLISRDNLIKHVLKEDLSSKSVKFLDSLIEFNQELIQIVFKKHRSNEMYFNYVFPLDILVKNRSAYLKEKNDYFKTLLRGLKDYMHREYQAVLPHQLLTFPSDVQARIDINVTYYKEIKVMYNNIYQIKNKAVNIVELILNSKKITKKHKVKVLTQKEYLEVDYKSKNVTVQNYSKQIPLDYQRRDIIIFEKFGCLIIPDGDKSTPYYDISPPLNLSVNEIFSSNWSE